MKYKLDIKRGLNLDQNENSDIWNTYDSRILLEFSSPCPSYILEHWSKKREISTFFHLTSKIVYTPKFTLQKC